MTTFTQVRANVADMLRGRTDLNSQIGAEIQNAIRHYNRRITWILERRSGTVTTVSGTAWYSTIDLSASAGISDTSSGTTPSATADLVDLIHMDYAKLEQGTTDWPLTQISYRGFEDLALNTNTSGTPDYITHYSGRLGLWPTPNAAYSLIVSGMFKPTVPSADSDESAWFDQHLELIELATSYRMATKWLHDTELAIFFKRGPDGTGGLDEQERLLNVESMNRRRTGRIKAHC